MSRTTGSSQRARGRARELISAYTPGGARPLALASNVVVTRGEGSYVYTDSGTRLLDTVSGHGVASLGHSHPRWVDAVVSQASRLAVTSLYTDELADYLEALAAVVPPRLTGIALSSTGAEAVEMAVRMAQTAAGRAGVLTFEAGFHGKTAAVRYTSMPRSPEAEVLAPHWLRTTAFPACAHDALDYHGCDEPVADDIARVAAQIDPDDIAAVLVEPVLGTAGNIPPKRLFLRALRELCDQCGCLLIFDESITGFGRTGNLFALQTFDVAPDVLVLSKGLGGGFPLSAVCAAPDLWQSSALSAPSATSSSYGANPLACAAGSATLEIVTDPQFLAQVRSTSSHAAVRLRALSEGCQQVARARGIGLMLGFDLVDAATGDLACQSQCERIVRDCRDRGVLLAANVPRVRVNPPLTVSTGDIDFLFDVLSEVLR
jgi:4-aminobutyrate aminotransferase-like enzyme